MTSFIFIDSTFSFRERAKFSFLSDRWQKNCELKTLKQNVNILVSESADCWADNSF